MNLDELRSVQSTERTKDSLQHLRPSFYEEVGAYIADLEAERDKLAEDADDPFSSPEVRRLTDEIETARDVVEAIYERRMGKLVKQASLAAAGLPADDEGLTAEEQDLFDDLVDRIEANKGRVLDVLDASSEASAGPTGDGSATSDVAGSIPDTGDAGATDAAGPIPTDPGAAPESDPAAAPGSDPAAAADGEEPPPPPPPEPNAGETDDGEGVSPADVMGPTETESPGPGASGDRDVPPRDDPGGDEPVAADAVGVEDGDDQDDAESGGTATDGAGHATDVDRMTVRITTDVGSILGVDEREYTLEREDVVTLPEQNAAPLVERDAAEPLE